MFLRVVANWDSTSFAGAEMYACSGRWDFEVPRTGTIRHHDFVESIGSRVFYRWLDVLPTSTLRSDEKAFAFSFSVLGVAVQ